MQLHFYIFPSFFFNLLVYHLPFHTGQIDFDIADTSSTQNAFHI